MRGIDISCGPVTNAVNASTKITPIFANKGFHPRMSFGPPRPPDRMSSKSLRQQTSAGNDFAMNMVDILGVLRLNLTCSREKQEIASAANRSPAPAYHVSDEVFLALAISQPHGQLRN